MMARTFGPRIPKDGILLWREHVTDDDAYEYPVLVTYDFVSAQREILWSDYPQPGHDASAELYPPRGVTLSDREEADLISDIVERESERAWDRQQERYAEEAY